MVEHPEHGVVKIKVDRFIRLKLREINATRDLLRIVPGDFVITSCKSSNKDELSNLYFYPSFA